MHTPAILGDGLNRQNSARIQVPKSVSTRHASFLVLPDSRAAMLLIGVTFDLKQRISRHLFIHMLTSLGARVYSKVGLHVSIG
jgi:hypothetical protein